MKNTIRISLEGVEEGRKESEVLTRDKGKRDVEEVVFS